MEENMTGPLARMILHRRSYLAEQAITEKWHLHSRARVSSKCAFCFNVPYIISFETGIEKLYCDACLCPPHICYDSGYEGLIRVMDIKSMVGDLPLEQLEEMVNAMKQLVIK